MSSQHDDISGTTIFLPIAELAKKFKYCQIVLQQAAAVLPLNYKI
jgi:hypothetical protein